MAAFLLGSLAAILIYQAGGAFSYLWRGGGLQFNLDQPTLVHQVRALSRLETVVYSLEKIVEGERANRWAPGLLHGDRILMIIHGQVTAGIDLSSLTSDSIEIADDTAALRLPPPKIFSSRIDNRLTRVYSRETGLFTPFDPYLESAVRRQAERELERAAVEDGILEKAERNARATLTSLLNGLGFREVRFHSASQTLRETDNLRTPRVGFRGAGWGQEIRMIRAEKLKTGPSGN